MSTSWYSMAASGGRFRRLVAVAWAAVALAGALPGLAEAGTRFSEPAVFDWVADGAYSNAALALGADGAFYGTTEMGGQYGHGTVFRFVPGQGIAAVHHFKKKEGRAPRAALLLLADGSLWGVASQGGRNDKGTVFRLAPGGKLEAVHAFDGVDGEYPLATLTQARDGWLYGATAGLTDAYAGSVFRIDPASRRFELLHRFEGSVNSAPLGHSPTGKLLQARDGYLYGTAYRGGTHGQGTVYRVDPASGQVQLVHGFDGSQGCEPYAGLTEGPDGALYGAATQCGAGGSGTVFRLTPTAQGADVQALHHFDWFNEASAPVCDLTLASDGYLYGCTQDMGYGSAFRILPNGHDYNRFVLAGWRTPSKGAFPWGRLVEHEGALWGTLSMGVYSEYSAGTIYKLTTTKAQP